MAASEPERSIFTGVKLRLADGTRLSEKEVWNTSLGGVFVEMKEPLAFGEELGLEFTFARNTPNIHCGGYVVWSTASAPDKAPGKTGIGLRLVDIGIQEMRRLAASVGRDL